MHSRIIAYPSALSISSKLFQIYFFKYDDFILNKITIAHVQIILLANKQHCYEYICKFSKLNNWSDDCLVLVLFIYKDSVESTSQSLLWWSYLHHG